MQIPDTWKPSAQQGSDTVLAIAVTQADVDAHPEWRGTYVPGVDTRAFVVETEVNCKTWNCWMRRDAKGEPVYVSEPLTAQQIASFVPAL